MRAKQSCPAFPSSPGAKFCNCSKIIVPVSAKIKHVFHVSNEGSISISHHSFGYVNYVHVGYYVVFHVGYVVLDLSITSAVTIRMSKLTRIYSILI